PASTSGSLASNSARPRAPSGTRARVVMSPAAPRSSSSARSINWSRWLTRARSLLPRRLLGGRLPLRLGLHRLRLRLGLRRGLLLGAGLPRGPGLGGLARPRLATRLRLGVRQRRGGALRLAVLGDVELADGVIHQAHAHVGHAQVVVGLGAEPLGGALAELLQ